MTTKDQTFSTQNMDFDALYAGRLSFEGSEPGTDFIPWDIGEPQAAVVALERTGGFRGKVLDVGCGRGDNAIMLAERGHDVIGVDGAQSAIQQAEQRAMAQGVRAQFKVADATELRDIGAGFDTVLDSGLYHCLNDEQRSAYAAALHRVCQADATLHLFCFAESVPSGTPIVQEALISVDDLHANLDRYWQIVDITPTFFATSFTRELLAGSGDPAAVQVDERGRVLLPMSKVLARHK
ncbi:class I SAM-dependent methyltransferase [Kibdelosporangium aridum]|nr:class I SAM-dependent methyltransferase [Kibdelosporangium aridum]